MQAFSRWTDPGGTLGRIVAETASRVEVLELQRAELENACASAVAGPSLQSALSQATVALLAEVKRRSPSKGAIAEGLDAVQQAGAYLAGGAAGASILTEPANFGGSVQDLIAVRNGVCIPTLKKDFHIAPIQLLEARALGASAALLIVRALSPDLLVEMMDAGRALDLELLVEVRDEDELQRALDAGARMVGINNRDLETLVIDPATADRLLPLIPGDIVAVAESGVRTSADVERYAAFGTDAVLVGSSLSAAADPIAATRALTGVAKVSRAG